MSVYVRFRWFDGEMRLHGIHKTMGAAKGGATFAMTRAESKATKWEQDPSGVWRRGSWRVVEVPVPVPTE